VGVTDNSVKQPLISVIIPTYNRAYLLPRAIRSVISQVYSNFELIIVEGPSSPNNALEIVKSFKDPRIIYISYKKGPKNPNFSRNIGISLAKGDIIFFLDDDDELEHNALEVIVDTFNKVKSLGVDILLFDRLDVEKNRVSGWGLERKERLVSYDELLCKAEGDFLCVFSRKALEGFRFPEKIIGFESVALLELHKRFLTYYVPKVIYRNYREHGSPRLSQYSLEKSIKLSSNAAYALYLFIKKYGKDLLQYCPKKYWGYVGALGYYLFLSGRRIDGIKNVFASLVHGAMPRYRLLFIVAFLLIPSKRIIHFYKIGQRFYNKYKRLLSVIF
jgi:glycosyltransferase involved in cell wall biosynthesis